MLRATKCQFLFFLLLLCLRTKKSLIHTTPTIDLFNFNTNLHATICTQDHRSHSSLATTASTKSCRIVSVDIATASFLLHFVTSSKRHQIYHRLGPMWPLQVDTPCHYLHLQLQPQLGKSLLSDPSTRTRPATADTCPLHRCKISESCTARIQAGG